MESLHSASASLQLTIGRKKASAATVVANLLFAMSNEANEPLAWSVQKEGIANERGDIYDRISLPKNQVGAHDGRARFPAAALADRRAGSDPGADLSLPGLHRQLRAEGAAARFRRDREFPAKIARGPAVGFLEKLGKVKQVRQ
jgi:hypothetical protein